MEPPLSWGRPVLRWPSDVRGGLTAGGAAPELGTPPTPDARWLSAEDPDPAAGSAGRTHLMELQGLWPHLAAAGWPGTLSQSHTEHHSPRGAAHTSATAAAAAAAGSPVGQTCGRWQPARLFWELAPPNYASITSIRTVVPTVRRVPHEGCRLSRVLSWTRMVSWVLGKTWTVFSLRLLVYFATHHLLEGGGALNPQPIT